MATFPDFYWEPSLNLTKLKTFKPSRWHQGDHHWDAAPRQAQPLDGVAQLSAGRHVPEDEGVAGISAGTEGSRRRFVASE